ncbi:SIMPL domain-containing protein [Pseudoalteromonas xiamenensis]|uniref:SIMPL domain-containing protein n=1 Tax=Pseudoalteromonas xiamenensis TaxID=882626 RepID=A0A975HL79_9GAMM|nr:SIMPL domain-containing protein [Pseudoalteromonas xiamenensis]QTH71667.1 SIMPL domain-containing protein [Pseudoalteromonas xiamenensis]
MKKLMLAFAALVTLNANANSLPDAPHLYVQGNAKIQVKPDRANIVIGIDDTQTNTVDAKKNVDAIAAKVIEIAKRYQIAEKDIQAEQLNVYRQTEYDREQNKQRFVGFRVFRNIRMTLTLVDKYPDLLQDLVDAGVTEFRDTQFSVADHNTILKTVQKAAIKDAKMAAKELAKDFDVRIGKLYSVSFSPIDAPTMPYMRAEKMMVQADSGAGAGYNTGFITVDAQVYAVYLID